MSKTSSRPSDHFDGRRFFNPGVDTDKSLFDLLQWKRLGQRSRWPARIVDPPAPAPPSHVDDGEAAFTFVGHSTYLIQVGRFRLITDPVFSKRASPFGFVGPQRVRAPGLAIEAVPQLDAVLLSHNHYDHMDLSSLRALAQHGGPTIVTGLGNGRYLERHGIGPTIELDWWESAELRPGLVVTFTPAQHWSSRTGIDRRRMLWGGHVVETDQHRIYASGDTGYFDGFRAVRERIGPPDAAILPIGAYEPRWFMRDQHMNPADAVQAHCDLGSRLSLAAHWGTFQLTDEAIDAPVLALGAALRERDLDVAAFQAPLPGQTIVARLGRAQGPEAPPA